ncbi:MAG: ATP-dependent ligase [Microbacteriaceae bacterium]|jgi:hypothetical protein|nr:ATP-dependent ligase [Microbacteriaceae bacterium]
MGVLIYGSSTMEVTFDDRALAHVQVVIATRLHSHERFFLSWRDHSDVGSGRSSIWIDSSVCLVFRYSDARPVRINPKWIALLSVPEKTSGSLFFQPEPGGLEGSAGFPHSHV